MRVKEVPLDELFKGRNFFVVPPFQRRYAWKEENFKMLWEDISAVAEGDRARHFMGTVIFEPSEDKRSVIIDGQQRLTTFFVILKVLEKLSEKNGLKLSRTIRSKTMYKREARLCPSLPDRGAFAYLVESPDSLKKGREHRGFKVCYEFFYEAISNYCETSKGRFNKNLEGIISIVLNDLIFVELVLASHDDVHSIFETINYAGVPLSSSDLARNFVLGLAKKSDKQQELNETYWRPLEFRLEENISGNSKKARKAELQKVLPELIRSFLVVEKRKYISASDAFREFRSFFKKGDLEVNLKKFVECGEIFSRFLNPEIEPSKKLSERLQSFVDLKMTTHYPVLIVLYRMHKADQLSVSQMKLCMQYVESFVIRRAFKSKVSRDLNQVFARIARDLAGFSETKGIDKQLKKLLIAAGWPSDDDFKSNFISSSIYTAARQIARYTLISLEQKNSAAHKEQQFDKSIQIEHVFPQQAKTPDWDEKDIPSLKKNLHVIGNLTLTGYNPKLSNFGFSDKLVDYKKSQYWLTKQSIAKRRQWTAQEIEKRSIMLVGHALKLWPGPS